MNECIETDVLILGCGIAGASAGLQLADAGVRVTIATRAADPHESNTFYAQGGIIYRGEGDSSELLSRDLQVAGVFMNNPEAVRILAENGPALIDSVLIKKTDISFDLDASGQLEVIREAAHSAPRIIHAADHTGKAIEIALINRLKDHKNVTLLPRHTAVDLLTTGHHSRNKLAAYQPQQCCGAYLFNQKDEQIIRCLARKTILATGGLGRLFHKTTNPVGSRGDGLAMAYRAGARVINCEYVQFHPTTFYHQNAPNFLLTEAIRGAGARLIHADGMPFMHHYAPDQKELAPRDIVARAMHQEMIKKDVSNVYLDIHSVLDAAEIKKRFPGAYQKCLQYGIDITCEPIPVVPGAHYFCGGVWSDSWACTSINQLYAIGEVSCSGIHGANRLASSSLLEGLVWGDRAARHICDTLKDAPQPGADDIPPWESIGHESPDLVLISQDMSTIQHIMWNYVGLVRNTHRLQRALNELRHLENEIERFYRIAHLSDSLIGLRNAVRAAAIITIAAWKNKTSTGCHYREE